MCHGGQSPLFAQQDSLSPLPTIRVASGLKLGFLRSLLWPSNTNSHEAGHRWIRCRALEPVVLRIFAAGLERQETAEGTVGRIGSSPRKDRGRLRTYRLWLVSAPDRTLPVRSNTAFYRLFWELLSMILSIGHRPVPGWRNTLATLHAEPAVTCYSSN